MITRANAAKFAGISKSVAKFKEIRDKVNKNKMPSVVKFRRQLQAAAEATLANKGAAYGQTPSSGIGALPKAIGGTSSAGGTATAAAVTIPIRIDDPHRHPRHGQRPLPLKQHQPVMVEEGQEFMRHVMEDVIKANRSAP
jgi:hypothetical protein